jgi:hypothetical protein
MTKKPTLSILQYNTMKSRNKVMASMLRDKRMLDFDIIAIQEPWRNEYINIMHHPCSQHLDLLYFDSPETRTCTFISKKISNASWTAIAYSPDLNTVTIEYGKESDKETVHIHNIYNPPTGGQSTIPLIVSTPCSPKHTRPPEGVSTSVLIGPA